MSVDINEIVPSASVVAKINGLHACTLDDVDEAVKTYFYAEWIEDSERGRRLMVKGYTNQRRLLRIVLYPVNEAEGTFRLATAF